MLLCGGALDVCCEGALDVCCEGALDVCCVLCAVRVHWMCAVCCVL